MDRWSDEQRGYAVKTYYQHGGRIVQNLHQFDVRRNHPVASANSDPRTLSKRGRRLKKGVSLKTDWIPESIAAVQETML